MNEATSDNNGVYLLHGHHGNGCRQSIGGRGKERERALRNVLPYITVPLFYILYSEPHWMRRGISLNPILPLPILHHMVSRLLITRQMLSSNIHLHTAWHCQTKRTPACASCVRTGGGIARSSPYREHVYAPRFLKVITSTHTHKPTHLPYK